MWSLLFGGATLAIAIAAAPVIAQPAEEGSAPEVNADAAKGQYLYFQTGCYACHGTIGQGAFLAGPKLMPPLVPYASFSAQLREPVSRMPRYGAETMSEQEVADIYAYLRAMPSQPKADAIDILKDES